MAGITPTPGMRPINLPSSPTISGQDAKKPSGDFGTMLRNYIQNVDEKQQASTSAVQNLISGKSEDLLPVISAMAKANLSFKLLMGVRDKVIAAYKQTMNMQI